MSRANGNTNGATKRSANGKVVNGQIPLQSAKAGNEKTDYTRWRLKNDRGCQTWHYLESDEEIKAWPQSTADKWYLGMDTVSLHRFSSKRHGE
jgi:lanosterol synthase